jgi:hypothetical protein
VSPTPFEEPVRRPVVRRIAAGSAAALSLATPLLFESVPWSAAVLISVLNAMASVGCFLLPRVLDHIRQSQQQGDRHHEAMLQETNRHDEAMLLLMKVHGATAFDVNASEIMRYLRGCPVGPHSSGAMPCCKSVSGAVSAGSALLQPEVDQSICLAQHSEASSCSQARVLA